MENVNQNLTEETIIEPDEVGFLEKRFVELIKKASVIAPVEQGDQRLKICRTLENGKPCKFLGDVWPLPGVKVLGCKGCGCALRAKAYIISVATKKVKCPHPEGNKWEEVDNNFSN